MSGSLAIAIGQHSDRGRKPVNQDFHGAIIPDEPLLSVKGVAVVLADGISSSQVSRIAAESAVKSFLTDYYCTPDTWSVKLSAQRVIAAANSWLHARTRQSRDPYDHDRGYVCALSALVIRAAAAHLFHVGDARIYRVAGKALEQLTEDHRVIVSSEQSYLGRALGVNQQVEIDHRAISVDTGDIFVLATDGVYEHVSPRGVIQAIEQHADDLDEAARTIVAEAMRQGSTDNLTVQIVRIESVPANAPIDVIAQPAELPCPPLLEARGEIDGYRIVRELHASSRSHLYLAIDPEDGGMVAIKTPSTDVGSDGAYLRRFRMEEWIARRIDSPHVLKTRPSTRRRSYLYIVSEYIEGQTLAQWMIDHPKPDLETVRGIVEQIAKGLQAFHRLEMLHQDLRPDNVMIDKTGTAKLVDFGATRIAGIADDAPAAVPAEILGTVQYTAPEYFLGEGGSQRSDIYSLGVITYQMLTGRLPYGAAVPKATTRSRQSKLRYRSVLEGNREIPGWIDGVLKKAVNPDPNRRYGELSEFTYDLRHFNRNSGFQPDRTPLIERNPLLIWQCLTAMLLIIILFLLESR
ncbi:MAG TPA: bifunctional protein-serine/threonine kinase/phosphatase [Pseudolabrys sp.]|nr:bifunctional protein-serine/threonine kinase/phosphatase [Pseudolabrys sp.]